MLPGHLEVFRVDRRNAMIARVWRVGGVEHRNNKEGDEVRWGVSAPLG